MSMPGLVTVEGWGVGVFIDPSLLKMGFAVSLTLLA